MATGRWIKTAMQHICYKPGGFDFDHGIGSVWECECGKRSEVIGSKRNPDSDDPREPYLLNVWREITVSHSSSAWEPTR